VRYELERVARIVEEKTAGLGSVMESSASAKEYLEKAVSSMSSIQENMQELRNDMFERNQYLNVIISDFTMSKETMEKNVRALEAASLQLKDTVTDLDRRTDDILNATMNKLQDLTKLRDMIYDDIASVETKVKKIQKTLDRKNRDDKRKQKKQTELQNMVKKIATRINKIDRQTRPKRPRRRRR
jgi:DNA repair exonuclease SbcCD ATPase subunit